MVSCYPDLDLGRVRIAYAVTPDLEYFIFMPNRGGYENFARGGGRLCIQELRASQSNARLAFFMQCLR